MKPKILITGATGNTGFALAERLAKLKVPFRALVHSDSREQLVEKLAAEVVVGDYNDAASIECALEGIEKSVPGISAVSGPVQGPDRVRGYR